MSQSITSRRENIIFKIASFIIIGVAAMVGFVQTSSAPSLRTMMVLLTIIAIIQARAPNEKSSTWQIHLYLGVQGGLVTALMFVIPGWTMFPILHCFLSVQAILLLSPNPGVVWIAAYVLATATPFAIMAKWDEALIALFVYGGGNAFFGSFANALVQADTARRKSQALLEELQEAHHQLQEYALRAEELAVVEERNRLAREMHDTLGHRLTVASVQLEGAQRLCPTDPQQAASMVGTVREQVREALSELRSTVAALRTPVEADLQLHSSLTRLIAHFEKATGLTVHRVFPEEMPLLSPAHRLALFRAAQEALTNVHRHAQAQDVWLQLTWHDEIITLMVSDNGVGIPAAAEQMGLGLRGMYERAAQLGGELHIDPRPGGGSQVRFSLPLVQEEDDG